jgi:hypothetical protein
MVDRLDLSERKCPDCAGTGYYELASMGTGMLDSHDCETCEGGGRVVIVPPPTRGAVSDGRAYDLEAVVTAHRTACVSVPGKPWTKLADMEYDAIAGTVLRNAKGAVGADIDPGQCRASAEDCERHGLVGAASLLRFVADVVEGGVFR